MKKIIIKHLFTVVMFIRIQKVDLSFEIIQMKVTEYNIFFYGADYYAVQDCSNF